MDPELNTYEKRNAVLDAFEHVDDRPEAVGTADHGLPLLL
jgi:hypothetical protein